MITSVAIQGNGIAACCCAYLLRDSNLPLQVTKTGRASLPAILLSPATQILLQDVFEDNGLFRGLPQIRKRVVLWGKAAQPVEVPHSGVVVPEALLLDRLWPRVRCFQLAEGEPVPDWRVICSRLPALDGEQRSFGARVAAASAVELHPHADHEACWIESLEQGWLFLLPNGSRTATLLSVGGEIESLLEQSRLIGLRIAAVNGAGTEFPAYPRIREPLCDTGWFACGTAAMGFDPICGEGAGHAVREAILVSAVLRALAGDARPAELLTHYSSRLLAGFLRHLEICEQFYRSASCGKWWEAELALLHQGIRWTRSRFPSPPPAQFRLVGFNLEAVSR